MCLHNPMSRIPEDTVLNNIQCTTNLNKRSCNKAALCILPLDPPLPASEHELHVAS